MRRRVCVVALLATASFGFACGGAGSLQSPSAMGPQGAVIRGTVEGAGSADAGLSASAVSGGTANIRVSVVGSSLSTSTDGSGQFVLSGVPAGRVELRFEGPGLDARLEIAGLADGQEIRITVKMSGNGVVLVSGGDSSPGPSPSPSPGDDDDDEEVEFTGRLDSISGTMLVVAGRAVLTNDATRIRRKGEVVPFSSLEVGQTVEVEGTTQAEGLLARKVTIEDEADDESDDEGDEDDDEDDDDDDDDDDDGDEDDDEDDDDDSN